MLSRKTIVGILVLTVMVVAPVSSRQSATKAYAQEHPSEHPQEHPAEHPNSMEKPSLSKEDLAEAIEAYVKKETTLKGGFFLVYDDVAKKPLVLSLEKVHKQRLSKVGEDLYFACADLKTPKDKLYDLDIFMKGADKDHLEVTEITIHKEAGKERYTWFEKGGIWKKEPVRGRKGR